MSNSDWIQLAALVLNAVYLLWHNRKTTGNVKTVLNNALRQNRSLLSRALNDIADNLSKEFGGNAVAQKAVAEVEQVVETAAHLQAGSDG